MLGRIVNLLRPTVTLSVTPERFTFVAASRTTTIESAVQVATDGRIRGFGRTKVPADIHIVEVFPADGSAADASVLTALCRRGLSLTVGRWGIIRPRVLVHHAHEVAASSDILQHSLRAAGARTVVFMQRGS